MQDRERSILWIVRCITALITIRKHLEKPFRDATKDDLRSILKWMEQKGYKASTNEKFRQVLKLFYKIIYGNNEFYPEQVKWFSSKVGKEKTGKETSMDMAEYLEEEVHKLIENTHTVQSKAFLACMYESGARPEEFLRLTNSDIRIDSKGAIFMLRGKIISLHNNLQSDSAPVFSSYCPKCGNANPNRSAFCNNCSFKLGR